MDALIETPEQIRARILRAAERRFEFEQFWLRQNHVLLFMHMSPLADFEQRVENLSELLLRGLLKH
jgi:hypothetical protein